MTLTPFTVEGFTGLNLVADPLEVGSSGATDLLNVEFDRRGRVRCRDGVTKLNSVSSSIRFFVPLTTLSPIAVAAVGPGSVDKYSLSGVRTAVGTWTADVVTPPAKLGTPTTAEMIYVASENAGVGVAVRKYDGASLSTGTGKPRWVATLPTSNRLAQAGYYAAADSPSGANGSQSTVFFSSSGAPDTYGANDWVQIQPGDGEDIQGFVTFGNDLYVFKRSNAFVFYGESVDADGEPIFNFRRISLPDPITAASNSAFYQRVAAGPGGVYFIGSNGLWVTQGGPPSRVPTPIDPVLDGTANTTWAPQSPSSWQIQWCGDRLYIAYALNAGGQRVLVWDPQLNVWTAFEYLAGVGGIAALPTLIPGLAGATFWVSDGADVFKSVVDQGTDAGVSVNWSMTSGKYPLSDPGRVAVSNESSIDGYGTVTLRLDSDLYSNQSGSATLGTAPAIAEGWPTGVDTEGRWVQHKLSGAGAGLVSRLTHHVSFVKPAGVR